MNTTNYAVNGVELRVVDEGSGPLVMLCHGFPELAYSWRHQVPALVGAGYRVLAPDQRGYGGSSRPAAVEDYDIEHLTGDLLALLDEVGEERAVFVGHDWGSMVTWSLAQRAPERVRAVVGMSVPFIPRGDKAPVAAMRAAFGDTFFYIVYFQEPGVADADLGADPAKTMTRFLTGLAPGDGTGAARMFAPYGEMGMVDRLPEPHGLPAWLTQAELDHYIAEFSRTGFTGGVNWYRNMDRNWERSAHLADVRVGMPALFITGANDPVNLMTPSSIMDGWVTDLRGKAVVEGAGHWVQQEKPGEVNAALLAFLAALE
ncbi:MAG: alpha/beta fold hydrolase [Acidimicrobiales bacterium]